MTQKNLCNMCNNYSVDNECELKNSCELMAILKENEKLKEENNKLSWKMSYMIDPNAIGNKTDRGCETRK